MLDWSNVLNPKYFNRFQEIIITKSCFRKSHNKNYSLQAIPIKKTNETHIIYNIKDDNVYQTLLSKLRRFSLQKQVLINPKHDELLHSGLMMEKIRFTHIVIHYYAKMISQMFRYKYPNNNYSHIEKIIQEFLY